MCTSCTSVEKETRVLQSRSYLYSHEATIGHQRSLDHIQHASLRRQALDAATAQEAIPVRALKHDMIPAVQLPFRRPVVPSFEGFSDSSFVDHLNGVLFDGGQDILDRFSRPQERHHAQQYLLDKYGHEVDDLDVTISHIGERFNRLSDFIQFSGQRLPFT